VCDAETDFWRGFAGDVDVVRGALATHDFGSPAGRAWEAALSGLLYHLEDGWKAPWAACLEDRGPLSEEAARGAVLAADMAGRAAFLAFDRGAHAEALTAARRAASFAGPVGLLFAELGELRQAVMEARPGLIALATELESRASSAGRPAVVVEAAALRALGELSVDVQGAVLTARRAARMARTESLPLPEYLANAVLARTRRFSDRPHLAVRILTALARLAPEPWLPWLAWELTFAGATGLASRLELRGDAPSARASRAAVRARVSATGGQRAIFDEAVRDAREALAAMPSLSRELERFCVGADPDADLEAAEEPLRRWCLGEELILPFGLVGIALHPRPDADDVVAYVVGRPKGSRRIFGSGVGFAPSLTHSSRPGRTETAICVLALGAGRELDKHAFFREVYGFEFRRELHQGPFEVLVHRLRKAMGDSLEVGRGEEKLVARVNAPFSVPDPRCAKPLDDRLLKTIAERNGGSARDIAKALGIPLRTIQGVIKQLAEDGACVAEKQGRRVVYRVEDTTFSEPTRQHTRRQLDLA
jgi:hypothetical protein